MSIEAMKLALEALELCYEGKARLNTVPDAIAALRTAIQHAEAQQPATTEPAQADSSEHLRVIASLGAALRRLSFAAQTTGGTDGPDAELQSAIGQAEQALSLGGIWQAMSATPEPVGFVDFQGTVFWHDGPPTADSLLFAAKPVSHDKAKWCEYVAGMVFAWLEMQENLKEEDRCIKAIAGIIERRMWALPTTRPAPSVPGDVVRDAERYRFIRDADVSDDLIPYIALYAMESLDEYIDAAMLAAKDTK